MADFILFDEGANSILNNGVPATCTFDLSTKTCEELGASATNAGGFAKATGTGYESKTEAKPTGAERKLKFAKKTWETGEATDWPAGVKSCVLRDATNSKLIAAWNLQAGGTARVMNAKNTTENYTPTLQL
jgi:hypothetical protein